MSLKKIANIFTDRPPPRVTIGGVCWDEATGVTQVALVPEAVIPVLRWHSEQGLEIVKAAAVPFVDGPHPPHVHVDLQLCRRRRGKEVREDVGWIYSDSSPNGAAIYQVQLRTAPLLKHMGVLWLHGHHPTPGEIEARENGGRKE